MKIRIKNKDQFLNAIKKDVKETMENEISKKMKELESEVTKEVLYDKYTPKVYRRRGDNGGMSDIKNMSHNIKDSNNKVGITVKNNTQVNPEFYYQYHPHLDEIIEDGLTYPLWFENDTSKYPFLNPRPFIKETQKRINNGELDYDIIKALKNKGWNIK